MTTNTTNKLRTICSSSFLPEHPEGLDLTGNSCLHWPAGDSEHPQTIEDYLRICFGVAVRGHDDGNPHNLPTVREMRSVYWPTTPRYFLLKDIYNNDYIRAVWLTERPYINDPATTP